MRLPSARSVCLLALRRWEQGRQFADDVLHEMLERHPLSAIDRAFFMEAFYGILRNLARLDFLIDQLGREDLNRSTRQVLRLGIYQIFQMRIPDHAAVNETVDLAGRARKLVNALLRRSLREKEQMLKALEDAPVHIRFSHPRFLVERWQKRYGEQAALQLCEWNNSPAEIFVCANTLKVSAGELHRASPQSEPSDFHPLSLKVRQIPFLWIANGLCYVQDPSTLLAPDLLEARPGENLLDACAAPGGKASYLAARMQNEGRLVACDAASARLQRLSENLQRLGISMAEVVQEDWLKPSSRFQPESFDRILIDAPCTNTGVIRRRIDVRWRLTPPDFERMAKRQFAMVEMLAPLLKPGGTLVYSTCSLEPEENEGVVQRIEKQLTEFRLVSVRQSLPFEHHVDGAFAARFEKR